MAKSTLPSQKVKNVKGNAAMSKASTSSAAKKSGKC